MARVKAAEPPPAAAAAVGLPAGLPSPCRVLSECGLLLLPLLSQVPCHLSIWVSVMEPGSCQGTTQQEVTSTYKLANISRSNITICAHQVGRAAPETGPYQSSCQSFCRRRQCQQMEKWMSTPLVAHWRGSRQERCTCSRASQAAVRHVLVNGLLQIRGVHIPFCLPTCHPAPRRHTCMFFSAAVAAIAALSLSTARS
jgi:hypothetical protein